MTRKRINLTIAPATDEALERLSADLGHSKSTLVDLAIAAYTEPQPQIYIQDCMPAMGDVVGGHRPAPVELPDGARATDYVVISGDDPDDEDFAEAPWPEVAPAWRTLDLDDISSVCAIARRNRDVDGWVCESIKAVVGDLREFLGERGPAVCSRGCICVFNADGTRVAVAEP